MLYDPQMTAPMKAELTSQSIEDLNTPDAVDTFLGDSSDTHFIVVNSVCGCAAAGARPSILHALANTDKKPQRVGTVFAGVDNDATNHARSKFGEYPPSSPSMVLFKKGKPVFFLPRHAIEGRMAEDISRDIQEAFNQYC